MEVTIKRLNDAVHFEAENNDGQTLQFDGSASIGGVGGGMRPMEILLSSVGACSVLDVVDILKKQRQPLEDIQIIMSGERPKEGTPKPFKAIHMHYILKGALQEEKVQRAISLAVEKYCSVASSLDPAIKITYDHEINR